MCSRHHAFHPALTPVAVRTTVAAMPRRGEGSSWDAILISAPKLADAVGVVYAVAVNRYRVPGTPQSLIPWLLVLAFCLTGCSTEREEPIVSAAARGSEAQRGTTLTNRVYDIAGDAARAEGFDLEKFAAPKVTFDPEAQQWRLIFWGIVDPAPGNYFHVLVDERTGKASVRLGY